MFKKNMKIKKFFTIKNNDEKHINNNNNEKITIDKSLLDTLFFLAGLKECKYNCIRNNVLDFYIVNDKHVIEWYSINPCSYYKIKIDNKKSFDLNANEIPIDLDIASLSFNKVKKLGEKKEPGIYFKGKKVGELDNDLFD